MCPASAAVSGAKMVLANPAARVRVVSAWTRPGPYQPVSAANAGGYTPPAIATPASSHAAKNHPYAGTVAIPNYCHGGQDRPGGHHRPRPVPADQPPGQHPGPVTC